MAIARRLKNPDLQSQTLSFDQETEYLQAKIIPHLSQAAKDYLKNAVFEQQQLLADWIIQNTFVTNSTSAEEVFLLLVTLIDNNLRDRTAMLLTLEQFVSSKLQQLKFADLVYFLFIYSRTRTAQPLDPRALTSKILDSLRSNPIKYFNNRENFSSNQIYQLPMLTAAQHHAAYVRLSYDVYTSLQLIGEDNALSEVTLKHCVELLQCLLQDYSSCYDDAIAALLDAVFKNVDMLESNDVLIMLKSMLLLKLRSPSVVQTISFDDRLAKLDKRAVVASKAFSPKLAESTKKYISDSDLIDLGTIPYIGSKLLSLETTTAKPKNIVSKSEEAIVAIVNKAGLKIKSRNIYLENSFSVDLLLEGNIVVEVNGGYHYTSEFLKGQTEDATQPPSAIEVIDGDSLERDYSVLNKYRGDDAIKIITLINSGYTYIGIDTRFIDEDHSAEIMDTLLSQSTYKSKS